MFSYHPQFIENLWSYLMSANINDRVPLPIGYHLHEYRIESILGEGNFGITYLALNINRKSNNKVVIKEYFPSKLAIRLSDQSVKPSSDEKIEIYQVGLKEFIKDNHILAQLNHRNLARVLELFESHNTGYYVMKYEPGQTLAQQLEIVGMLPHTALMKIFPQLLSALTVAHKSGILHLNLNPDHIYLRKKDQSPFLFNFGRPSYVLNKRCNNIIEISSYTPFEQYEKANIQEHCTDIYSLGAVLYHVISGKPPIDALKRKGSLLIGDPDPLVPIVTMIPPDKHYSKNLLEGIDWALAIDCKERPQTIVQWSTFILSHSPQQQFLLQQSLQKIMIVFGIIIAIFATGFGVKYLFSAKKPVKNAVSVENKELENKKILLSLLRKLPYPTTPIIQPITLPIQEILSLKEHKAGICVEACLTFSPDGRLLASGSWDHTIKIWNIDTGDLLQTFQGHQDLVLSIAFSPNGLLLASGSADKTIKLWDVNTGESLQTLKQENWVSSLDFSPDGQMLAVEGDDNSIKLLELSSNSLLQTFIGHENVINSVKFSPDGTIIASGSADGNIKLWEINSGNLLQTFKGNEILSIAFSPDGLLLASGDTASQIKLWGIKSGKLEKTLKGHKNWVLSVIFSPNGHLLASGSHDNTIRLWSLPNGKLLKILTGHKNDVNSIAFSPDGSILASGSRDKTIKLWHHL
jgi:serine/threonine protein kinase